MRKLILLLSVAVVMTITNGCKKEIVVVSKAVEGPFTIEGKWESASNVVVINYDVDGNKIDSVSYDLTNAQTGFQNIDFKADGKVVQTYKRFNSKSQAEVSYTNGKYQFSMYSNPALLYLIEDTEEEESFIRTVKIINNNLIETQYADTQEEVSFTDVDGSEYLQPYVKKVTTWSLKRLK